MPWPTVTSRDPAGKIGIMTIKILFFASLREQVGTSEVCLEAETPLSLSACWQQASQGLEMPANTLCALNMAYTRPDALARDGDEVAFFPPVTGGQQFAVPAQGTLPE